MPAPLYTEPTQKPFTCYLIWSSPLSSDFSIYSSPMWNRKAERENAYRNGNVFLRTPRNPQERKEEARSPGSQFQAVRQVLQVTRKVSLQCSGTHLLSLFPTVIGWLTATQHGASPSIGLSSPLSPLRYLWQDNWDSNSFAVFFHCLLFPSRHCLSGFSFFLALGILVGQKAEFAWG